MNIDRVGGRMPKQGSNEAGSPSSAARWHWVYGEMLRIEEHRTDELQNQQARIRSILGVNGFLLGFLAATGILGPGPSTLPRPILVIYVVSLIVLSAALILGIMTLLPKIPIRGRENSRPAKQPHGATPVPGLFLDPKFFVQNAPELAQEELLRKLCLGLEANMRISDHVGTLARRRRLINLQLYCISLAVLLLAIVLLGIAIR